MPEPCELSSMITVSLMIGSSLNSSGLAKSSRVAAVKFAIAMGSVILPAIFLE